jgi:hypothetical protein
MKLIRRMCQVLAAFATAFRLCSQDYAIAWHTSDGGGGTSTGGGYALSGTIGQPDAAPALTNGPYSVLGGFWAMPIAVQTPGAPFLSISPTNAGFVRISWTMATGTNWVLQQTAALCPANWTNAPSGFTNPALVPVQAPARFYRLIQSP